MSTIDVVDLERHCVAPLVAFAVLPTKAQTGSNKYQPSKSA
jgi:hypothetical protein